jgi:hypothetical protein
MVELPVLHLQHQNAPARVHHAKVGVGVLWPHGHVVPEQVIVIEFVFEPLRQAALAAGHAGSAGAQRRYQSCHAGITPLGAVFCYGLIMPPKLVFG